jgi:Tol biopolymer transport system component
MRRALAAAAIGAAVGAVAAHAAAPSRNGLVAFVRCCGSGTGIYAVRPDGGGQRLVYRALHDDAPLTPAWSPNGKQIAYVPGAPLGGLWVMNANGTGRRRIVRGNGDPLFPSWSTDGTKIVFADLANRRSSHHDIYVVRTNGTSLRRLTTSPVDETNPAWAPDDSAIVYRRGFSLWQMRTDGTRQRLLLANGISPSWSPGATHIAFIRGGDPWIAKRNGTGAKRVVHEPAQQISVAWSPDGRWLVTGPIDRGDLVLVAANGASTKPLTRQGGYFNADPSWQRLR